jgi:CubicO group peptidase (beta-lactamase class C family)
MENTTLSFDEVTARGQYATPHGMTIEGRYEPISLDIERVFTLIGPSGGLWSTLEDMARYMALQLNTGVAPDGTRIVSEENLLVTRQPQVKMTAESSYGLGWMVGTYKGLPMVEHGGNTLGFSSDFGFLPTADLGILVLANAQGANTLGIDARVRLIELLYGLESEVEPSFDFTVQMIEESRAQLAEQLGDTLDVAAVEPFVGDYTNAALGSLTALLEDGRLYFDVGEFRTELLPKLDDDGQPDGYITTDPPLVGVPVRLEEGADGERQVVFGLGLTEYTFVPANGQ